MNRFVCSIFGAVLAVATAACNQDACPDGPASADVIDGPTIGADGNNADNPFRALAIRPDDADAVYVGSEGNGLLASDDGGGAWRRLRAGLLHCAAYPEIYSIAIDPDRPDRMLMATNAGPGPTGSGTTSTAGIYRSDDGGDGWPQVNGGLPTGDANAVIILPGGDVVIGLGGGTSTNADDDAFYPGGLFTGAVDATSWVAADAPADATGSLFWQIVARPGGLLVFGGEPTSGGGSGVGLLVSHDRGASWTTLADPLAGRPGAHLDASDDLRVIYADARVEGGTPRFWRSDDGGDTWTSPPAIAEAEGPIRILDDEGAVALVGIGDRLLRTEDSFATVTEVAVAPTRENSFTAIEVAPSDPSVIYATTKGLLVYRSVDGGLTFELREDLRAGAL